MLNMAYTHASVVLVIFHYHMLKNKQSDRHSLYSMTSVVVFFAYPISLSHNRYFCQFWGTATFTSESLHTARCNSLYL